MKFREYLIEATKHSINIRMKKRLNTAITKLLKPTYFKKIPLQPIFDVLDEYNLVPLQEDNRYWDGMLIGGVKSTVHTSFKLGVKSFGENGVYPVIKNAELILSYYQMSSGKYEIIAYIG